MKYLLTLCVTTLTAIVAEATLGTDYSPNSLTSGLHEILANGPALSSEPHLSDPVPPTGPGYASAASMGASPNRRAYDMFGHAEPDRGANPCPYGWFGFKDSCYLLSSDKKPWVNAAIQCASMHAHLACIETAEENEFLRRLLKEIRVDQGCWHGLNELLHPGTETYGWGLTQQACTKYDWYGGEPVSPPSGNHLCGMFFQAYDYHWHVGDCTKPYRYICEMKKGQPCLCQL
eukprot:XP_011433912.1 PREDICTED: perlucin-like protein [Crassostrea gigas]